LYKTVSLTPPPDFSPEVTHAVLNGYVIRINNPYIWSQRKVIPVVDDELMPRKLAERYLRFIFPHAQYVHCENGQKAVDYVAQHSEDILFITMDIDMPVKNGKEAAREINNLPDNKLPIFHITSHTANEIFVGDNIGLSLVKGFLFSHLMELLRKLGCPEDILKEGQERYDNRPSTPRPSIPSPPIPHAVLSVGPPTPSSSAGSSTPLSVVSSGPSFGPATPRLSNSDPVAVSPVAELSALAADMQQEHPQLKTTPEFKYEDMVFELGQMASNQTRGVTRLNQAISPDLTFDDILGLSDSERPYSAAPSSISTPSLGVTSPPPSSSSPFLAVQPGDN
jgi:CheY-like chemotaxis protein